MKAYWFIYENENGARIRIKAKRRPGPNTRPARGTWIVQEWVCRPAVRGFFTETVCNWQMPSFPEITWGTLQKLKFIEKVEA